MSARSDQTVEMVDLRAGQVHLSGGEILEIKSWWEDGERCEHPPDATHCVAGPDMDGFFWTIEILGPKLCQ